MTAVAFILFVLAVAIVVVVGLLRNAPWPTGSVLAALLPLWLFYVGLLGASGWLADVSVKPPAILFVAGPTILFIALGLVASPLGRRLSKAFSPSTLIGFQFYRTGVELFLHQLWLLGLVPRMLTFEGANFDFWIGLTAPVAAFVSTRGTNGRRAAIVWSILGLFSLANVIVRSVATTPVFHMLPVEVPNRAIGFFPYAFIPGFLAPLAISLHVLALRSLLSRSIVLPRDNAAGALTNATAGH